ncbi:hypothetical protein FV226_18375 [Methylobacterium sp. WL12]|uniref:hypothetical protein n=1 Tax=Methylobacterium sp. WL12 TaxID=2603890 RepID=UPI0011CBE031|nr:hypothetical protein [Methylobacterium sp. WL12]TXM69590.1 hypothetical protein FV226_18375 [Methylobacterium sp. WL12]
MTIALRTRADLTAAGRAMANEAAEALHQHLCSLTSEQMDDADRIEQLAAEMFATAEAAAANYRRAGIPEAWVAKFLSTFCRTMTAECRAMSDLLRQAARTA